MSIRGWQQETVWLVGARRPLGEPHDGFGQRPLVRAAQGPQGQPGLLISDELANSYLYTLDQTRLGQRHWLQIAQSQTDSPSPLGSFTDPDCDNHRYATLRSHIRGHAGVTLEGTTAGGSALHRPMADRVDLIQSCCRQSRTWLHAHHASHSGLTFHADRRLLLEHHGVPETIHWRRDASCDLLLAMDDGTLRRWEGLDDPSLSPLPGPGDAVLAGGTPMRFHGLAHICVVDWNLRGRSDLLAATAQGELWLFYDVGDDNHVAYDRGRLLCDEHGPISLFGGGSAAILHQAQERWLVACDSQGQLWHWPLVATTSWAVADWREAGVIDQGQRHVASSYEPGHWWLQHDAQNRPMLRLGPPAVEQFSTPGMPVVFPLLPSELTLASPCHGLCEVHVTLASLKGLVQGLDDALDSMLDIRLDDQPQPRMISLGDMHAGPLQEIHWDTLDLTDRHLCLCGVKGGFSYKGGLPVAIAGLRIVPLTPQRIIHAQPAAASSTAAAHPAGIELDHAASPASPHPVASVEDEMDDDEADDEQSPEPGEELLGEELLGEPGQRDAIPLAGMLNCFEWSKLIRTDSMMEVDDLIARHQEAGIGRVYFKLGGAAWEYPTMIPGGRCAVPPHYTHEAEAWSRRQADHFEHINRLELAAGACRRRGMELYGWIHLQAHDQTNGQKPGSPVGGAVSQFYLDHPEYLEKDIHGRPVPGKLCLGHQPVRDHYIQVAVEALSMGAQGLMIDAAHHLPCVMYGDPVLAEFQDRHDLDMRQLSPFDLRVVKLQGEVMARFLRELREAMHRAMPRLRAPLQVSVGRVHAVMGCDPVGWAREHLVDAVILQHDSGIGRGGDLAPLVHALQDTYTQPAAALSRSNWNTPAHSLPAGHLSREATRYMNQGAAFVLLGDCATLLRHRSLCQAIRRINHPHTPRPRAMLG